eukprot:CAMPEP_0178962376 /NCGR_PEP_ID=MMETSP0789-20121207/14323_1 /TAXON_ID=3005 /ORGANISM="Rhizosolenia setigera, Strain CCMP 1694" /LENGTH=75 /DNA_ID=CAMNT_0020646505 /DNA_START=80 /DNA_END=307 /DNA_ORIENTATION=+
MTLTYPNLVNCSIEIRKNSDVVLSTPPESISNRDQVYDILNRPIPTLYDFSTEKKVMQRKEEIMSTSNETTNNQE